MAYDEWPAKTIVRLRKLWGEGMPTVEIGLTLGYSKSAVCGKARRLDLPRRGSPISRGPTWKAGGPGPGVARKPRTVKPVARQPDGSPASEPCPPVPRCGAQSLPRLPSLTVDGPPIAARPRRAKAETPATPRAASPAAPVLRHQCQWPLTNGKPWRFCDAPCERLYCKQHAKQSHGSGTRSERSADDTRRLPL